MPGVLNRSGPLTGSALGKRTRDESETAEAVFSKKRKSSVDSKISLSLLVAIPREIRDMVVGNLLRAGDLSILQVSKALNEEALERINQEATCRIYYGCPDHAKTNFLRPANPAEIRNVEFRFHITSHLSNNPPTVAQFQEDCAIFRLDEFNRAPRSTCNLTLEYGTVGLGPQAHEMLNRFFNALWPLTGFEDVVLKVVPGPTDPTDPTDRFFGPRPPAWLSRPETQVTIEQKLKPGLEHFLRPVTMVGEGDGRRMVFHPRRLNTKFYPGQYIGMAHQGWNTPAGL